MSSQSNPLHPTFEGFVASTFDSLLLFEACLSGQLKHVARRPHDRERRDIIKSSNVFIYEENVSGIKRWTDGVIWSPSRILGNFLIYRELDKPFPPGQKKRALNRKPCPAGGIGKADSTSHLSKDVESAYIGSLTNSYSFKTGGLVKKTISISFRGIPHHLVSYYNVADAAAGNLKTPSRLFDFHNISPRIELIISQKFRVPLMDEVQDVSDENGSCSGLLVTMANIHLFTGASNGYLPELCLSPQALATRYTHHPMHQSRVGMDPFTLVQVPQPPPFSILPSVGSSASPLIPQSISPAVPSSTTSLSNSAGPLENDSLGQTSRFSMENDVQPTMPLHYPTWRNSGYELEQPTVLYQQTEK